MAAQRIGHVANKGPSVFKEIVLGMSFGLMAGGLWKMHHWNNQRRTKEFYDMLEKGEISVLWRKSRVGSRHYYLPLT